MFIVSLPFFYKTFLLFRKEEKREDGRVVCWFRVSIERVEKMVSPRKRELIGRVLEQVSELPRSKLVGGIALRVIQSERSGGRIITGCLARGEIKRPSKKGGFKNGTLVLRPTTPALDHEECSLKRIKIPICQIDDVVVEVR